MTPDGLAIALKLRKCKRTDIEDMIWEVDEDCDRMINWEEFKAMFYRVRHDKTGGGARRLFNVVEFMMHDKDQSGNIDMDECMEILFRRFGKEQLEARVNEFLNNDEDDDKEISFAEFLHMDSEERHRGHVEPPGLPPLRRHDGDDKGGEWRLLRQMGIGA